MNGLPDEPDSRWCGLLVTFTLLSVFLSQIVILIVGATIIGSERQDRGLEFLLTLPPTRSKILLAKSLYSLMVIVVTSASFLLVNEILVARLAPDYLVENRKFGLSVMSAGIAMFGTAWLASVYWRGVAVPISVALTTVVVILMGVIKYSQYQDWSVDDYANYFYKFAIAGFLLTGIVTFIVGWMGFIRRFEP
jgi:ABC-type transport system involved in multi-copper enzyme maturation permease subunit